MKGLDYWGAPLLSIVILLAFLAVWHAATLPETEFEWKIPQWSNAIERNRARTYFQAYAAAAALYFCERAMNEVRAGHTKTWNDFVVPSDAIGCGFHEAVRGMLSHHLVIRDGRIAN